MPIKSRLDLQLTGPFGHSTTSFCHLTRLAAPPTGQRAIHMSLLEKSICFANDRPNKNKDLPNPWHDAAPPLGLSFFKCFHLLRTL